MRYSPELHMMSIEPERAELRNIIAGMLTNMAGIVVMLGLLPICAVVIALAVKGG